MAQLVPILEVVSKLTVTGGLGILVWLLLTGRVYGQAAVAKLETQYTDRLKDARSECDEWKNIALEHIDITRRAQTITDEAVKTTRRGRT